MYPKYPKWGTCGVQKWDRSCKNYYEVCSNCKKYGENLKGCVEDKKRGWHDNGGYLPDADEKNAGSWLKWKN